MDRPARVTAVLDQLAAANTQARRCFNALGDVIGSDPDGTPPIGAHVVALKLTNRAAHGQITVCQHLSVVAPSPAFWIPWAPGRIQCLTCSVRSAQRIKGTREDRRCDSCKRHSGESIYQNAVLIPAASLELSGLISVQLPIVVLFGLCRSCQRIHEGKTENAA